MSRRPTIDVTDARSRIEQLSWYHTIDVSDGLATPGWFDLRHALPLMPWPDVRGARCLDVGTWDGFYAFELERRGAAEVVAVDVPDLTVLDYPPEVKAKGRQLVGDDRSAGFRLLRELLGSKVELRPGSIYDLDPADIGTFDLVVVGSLLVHLQDPVRALDAVRRVTSGRYLAVEPIHPRLADRRRPLFELRGESQDFQWWLASDAGLTHLLHVGGFDVERASRPFVLRATASADRSTPRPRTSGEIRAWLTRAAMARDTTPVGVLHRALLARPRF
jgi:SAM-dependent methyltransferase